jgi:putative spermidine/putrescine transport system ATP-binding protein
MQLSPLGLKDNAGQSVPPRSTERDVAVSFAAVSKDYGLVRAVHDLSLDVCSGQFVTLLGPSGCGKTTLLNLIAGFITPDRGDVLINGHSMRGVPPHGRNVGVVFQDYALFPHMRVAENLAFPLEVRGIMRAAIDSRIAAALELVRLSGLGGRRPDQLSGGQQQRVALARALIYQPPILLLDEPFGALDRRLRDSMQLELKSLHRRLGITFVFVTHDQDEAMAMADLVVVMRNGRIQQVGAPMALYDRPRTRFVATFLGDCNVIEGEATAAGIRHAGSGALLHLPERPVVGALGEARAVALRPEWISLLRPGEAPRAGNGVVEGRVSQLRFLGRELLLEVESALGTTLVRVPRTSGEEGPSLESSLKLCWNARRTVPLEEAE